MRFWDSSALLPLVLREPVSPRVEVVLQRDPDVVLWWGTPAECASALARRAREGALRAKAQRQAEEALGVLFAGAYEVLPGEEVRERAKRLLAVHPLRAADALQLGAALSWCRERPRGAAFVCLDARLRGAAAREGFLVMPYDEEVHEGGPEA